MRKVLMGWATCALCAAVAGSAAAGDVKDVKERTVKGPTMQAVPSSRSVSPGDTLTVDVFVGNVQGLGGYQAAVKVSGGDSGQFVLEKLVIDNARKDYVFGEAQVVKAEAPHAGQMGAVRMNGSSDVPRMGYLGTYTYRVPLDAQGTFTIDFDRDPRNTFLRDGSGLAVSFQAAKAASITVGNVAVDRVDAEEK